MVINHLLNGMILPSRWLVGAFYRGHTMGHHQTQLGSRLVKVGGRGWMMNIHPTIKNHAKNTHILHSAISDHERKGENFHFSY